MTAVCCQFLRSWSSWLCKFPLTLEVIHRYSVRTVQRALSVATGKSSYYYNGKLWLIIVRAAQDSRIHCVSVTAGGADTGFILRWPTPSSVLRKMCMYRTCLMLCTVIWLHLILQTMNWGKIVGLWVSMAVATELERVNCDSSVCGVFIFLFTGPWPLGSFLKVTSR